MVMLSQDMISSPQVASPSQ